MSFEGVPEVLGTDLGVRISGIDTAEKTDKRKCIKKKAKIASDALALAIGDQTVDLNFCFRDKFYRLNCTVRVTNGIDLGNYMLENGYAVPYSGGAKIPMRCK